MVEEAHVAEFDLIAGVVRDHHTRSDLCQLAHEKFTASYQKIIDSSLDKYIGQQFPSVDGALTMLQQYRKCGVDEFIVDGEHTYDIERAAQALCEGKSVGYKVIRLDFLLSPIKSSLR